MLHRRSIRERVINTIRGLVHNPELRLTDNSSIADEIAPDSLTRMTLFVALEDEFQRSIPPEEVEDIRTLGEIIRYIETNLPRTSKRHGEGI